MSDHFKGWQDGHLPPPEIPEQEPAEQIKEDGGQVLDIGAIADGEYLLRSGTDIVGDDSIDEYAKKRSIMVIVFSRDEKVISEDTLITFPAPFDGILVGVKAMVNTASTSGGVVTRLRNNTTATYMLSTNITVDQNKVSSLESSVQPVISSGTIANDDIISIDCTSAGEGAKGLILTLYVEMK